MTRINQDGVKLPTGKSASVPNDDVLPPDACPALLIRVIRQIRGELFELNTMPDRWRKRELF